VTCDEQTGQCDCRDTFEGLTCNKCKPNFYNYPICEGTLSVCLFVFLVCLFVCLSFFLSGVSVLYQTGNLIIRRFGSAKLLRFFLSYTLLQTVTQTPRFFSSKIK